MAPFAAIDLGTNTARLLVAECRNGKVEPLRVMRRICRLGGGFSKEMGLAPDAMERAVDALKEFAEEIRRYDVSKVRAVATSAVRDAANGASFRTQVAEITGIELEIISGEEEGVLTLEGVKSAIDPPAERLLVFDIGGGSTEYTSADGTGIRFTRSLPLGVVRLVEGGKTQQGVEEKVRELLTDLRAEMAREGALPDPAATTLVGTAGTATTLAAIHLQMEDYDYRRVNNHVIGLEDVAAIHDRLSLLSPAERLLVPGLEKGREDLIVAGSTIALETMTIFGFRELKVSDFGLLEGVLLSVAS